MKKNFKTHFLAVFIAWIFSYGLYLTIIAPWSTNLSADILGIQKWDVVSSDILIEQFDEYVTFSANRTMDEMRSLHILVMYDDEYVDAWWLSVESSKAVSQSFERNQWVIVVTTPQWIQANDQLFTLQWILKSDDLIIADINATLDDWSSERLLFSQPVE
jgi:hypothetical protein